MNVQQMMVGVLLSVGMMTNVAFAQMPADAKAAMVQVDNKICPVSGEKVGEMGDAVSIEHNGKMYHLCCTMCKKDFKANPDKFAKIAEDNAATAVK